MRLIYVIPLMTEGVWRRRRKSRPGSASLVRTEA
jgi:hypothetical protein